MPGYPASHSCLRLTEKDAVFLYNWANEWVLFNQDSVNAKRTPVIVFGAYPFDGAKPRMKLINNPHALDITKSIIEQKVQPFKSDILLQQQKRSASAIK